MAVKTHINVHADDTKVNEVQELCLLPGLQELVAQYYVQRSLQPEHVGIKGLVLLFRSSLFRL